MSNRPKSGKRRTAPRKPLPMVDSKKKPLDMMGVLDIVLSQQNKNLDSRFAGLMLASELKMEGSDFVQYGNTLFITHPLPKPGQFLFRALNADTPVNLVDNLISFFEYERSKGNYLGAVQFNDDRFIRVLKLLGHRYIKNTPGTGYKIGRLPNGMCRAFIKIGNEQV